MLDVLSKNPHAPTISFHPHGEIFVEISRKLYRGMWSEQKIPKETLGEISNKNDGKNFAKYAGRNPWWNPGKIAEGISGQLPERIPEIIQEELRHKSLKESQEKSIKEYWTNPWHKLQRSPLENPGRIPVRTLEEIPERIPGKISGGKKREIL